MEEKVLAEVEKQVHIVFIYVEAIAVLLLIGTVCYYIISTVRDSTVPTSTKNRLLFGVLVFGLVVFVLNKFGYKLSNDTMIFVLGVVVGSVGTIMSFYFKENAETNGNGEPSGNVQTGATPTPTKSGRT